MRGEDELALALKAEQSKWDNHLNMRIEIDEMDFAAGFSAGIRAAIKTLRDDDATNSQHGLTLRFAAEYLETELDEMPAKNVSEK